LPGRKTTTKRVKFLAFSCAHVPLLDRDAAELLLMQIADHKPKVIVNLGDGHEADAASKFEHDEYDWDLKDEFKLHNAWLAEIRKAAPRGAKLVFCEGNHDNNIRRKGRLHKGVRTLCDYRDHEPELKRWEFYPYRNDRQSVFRLGQVTFGHGWDATLNGDEFQSILLGVPYGLWVGGHTHRPVGVTQAMRTKAVPLPRYYANAGCLCDMDPEYMARNRSHSWGHGCVIGDADPNETVAHERHWSAKTVVWWKFDEWMETRVNGGVDEGGKVG